jgi:hypothetical protein
MKGWTKMSQERKTGKKQTQPTIESLQKESMIFIFLFEIKRGSSMKREPRSEESIFSERKKT